MPRLRRKKKKKKTLKKSQSQSRWRCSAHSIYCFSVWKRTFLCLNFLFFLKWVFQFFCCNGGCFCCRIDLRVRGENGWSVRRREKRKQNIQKKLPRSLQPSELRASEQASEGNLYIIGLQIKTILKRDCGMKNENKKWSILVDLWFSYYWKALQKIYNVIILMDLWFYHQKAA